IARHAGGAEVLSRSGIGLGAAGALRLQVDVGVNRDESGRIKRARVVHWIVTSITAEPGCSAYISSTSETRFVRTAFWLIDPFSVVSWASMDGGCSIKRAR